MLSQMIFYGAVHSFQIWNYQNFKAAYTSDGRHAFLMSSEFAAPVLVRSEANFLESSHTSFLFFEAHFYHQRSIIRGVSALFSELNVSVYNAYKHNELTHGAFLITNASFDNKI
jgi:hypothetical protein